MAFDVLSPDVVNGSIEAIGGILLWGSVWRLWKDREVKGIFWPAWFFYFGWGAWNLYYYPSLGQWFSFTGGLIVVTANLTWCTLAAGLWLGKRHK